MSRRNFTIDELLALYPLLQKHLDWIGTVEGMQTTTLPLLSFLLTRNTFIGTSFSPQNVEQHHAIKILHIQFEKLSNDTIECMKNNTQGDNFLYKSAQRNYHMTIIQTTASHCKDKDYYTYIEEDGMSW